MDVYILHVYPRSIFQHSTDQMGLVGVKPLALIWGYSLGLTIDENELNDIFSRSMTVAAKRQKVIVRVSDRLVFEESAYEAEITHGLKNRPQIKSRARAEWIVFTSIIFNVLSMQRVMTTNHVGDVISNAKMSAAQFC